MSLIDWNKNNVFKYTLDHTGITEDLADFPVLLNIGDSVGKNNADNSSIITELADVANNKKIAVVYPSLQEHWVEEYDSYTKLLIHSDTVGGSTNFADASLNNTVGGIGGVEHSDTVAKFGNTSIYGDGSGDYLSIPHNDSNSFDIDTTFTIDCWIYLISLPTSWGIWSKYGDGGTVNKGMSLTGDSSGSITFILRNATSSNDLLVSVPNGTIVAGNWYHVSSSYNGAGNASGVLMHINGTLIEGTVIRDGLTQSFATADPFRIGARVSDPMYFPGYIDEFRISKGIVRWTEDFTPPTAPYEKESNVITYIHGEQEQLFCEIMGWDTDLNEAQLWVKAPRILSNQPTDLLLYYDKTQEDNTQYIGDTGDLAAQQVWSNNYVAVSHLEQTPVNDTASIKDSVNSMDLTPYNVASGALIPADIGHTLTLRESNDKLTSPYNPALRLTGAVTVEVICTKREHNPNGWGLISNDDTVNDTYGDYTLLASSTDERAYFSVQGTSNRVSASADNVLIADSRRYIVGTYDMQNIKLYADGIEESSIAFTENLTNANGTLQVGHYFSSLCNANADFEMFRISSSSRSSSWIAATNVNYLDQLCTVVSGSIYTTGGYVKERGEPVQRQVFLYERTSGVLMDKCMSDVNGYYSLTTTVSGSHNVVCLDAAAAPDYEDLIISKIEPTEVI